MLANCQTNARAYDNADLTYLVQPPSLRSQVRSWTLEATVDLIAKVQEGDETACEILVNRYWRQLKQFAHSRLPRYVRSITDTDDIVQDALVKTFRRLRHFDCRHSGALLAYLRQAVLHRVVDEVRSASRRGASVAVTEAQVAQTPSPLARVLGKESAARYRAALLRLRARDRKLVVLRLQQGLSYEAIAQQLQIVSPEAARTACARAMLRLASAVNEM
jgi:RNA polymerase sigma-70 factor, ECF subfamily